MAKLETKVKLYRLRIGPGKNYRVIYQIRDEALPDPGRQGRRREGDPPPHQMSGLLPARARRTGQTDNPERPAPRRAFRFSRSYLVIEGGASAGAAPNFLFGSAPIVITIVPPCATSACRNQDFPYGLPFSVTDWM